MLSVSTAGSWSFYLLCFVSLFLRGIGSREKILCNGQARSDFFFFLKQSSTLWLPC